MRICGSCVPAAVKARFAQPLSKLGDPVLVMFTDPKTRLAAEVLRNETTLALQQATFEPGGGAKLSLTIGSLRSSRLRPPSCKRWHTPPVCCGPVKGSVVPLAEA